MHPFPTDKSNLPARAVAFGGFTVLASLEGIIARPAPDVVLAMSPPLTLGLAGWAVARARRVPFVFNIQDVFPDVAVELGLLTGQRVIAAASLARADDLPPVRRGHGAVRRPGRQRAGQDHRGGSPAWRPSARRPRCG